MGHPRYSEWLVIAQPAQLICGEIWWHFVGTGETTLCVAGPTLSRSERLVARCFVTHPPLPCVLSGEGLSCGVVRAQGSSLLSSTPYYHLVPVLPENDHARVY